MWGRNVLPPWPVVPPRLWATLAGCGLVLLNLAFEREIWWQHPQAGRWSWAVLCGLLLAVGAQTIPVLWRWPDAYRGPALLRPLFSLATVVLSVAIAVVLPVLLFALFQLVE